MWECDTFTPWRLQDYSSSLFNCIAKMGKGERECFGMQVCSCADTEFWFQTKLLSWPNFHHTNQPTNQYLVIWLVCLANHFVAITHFQFNINIYTEGEGGLLHQVIGIEKKKRKEWVNLQKSVVVHEPHYTHLQPNPA